MVNQEAISGEYEGGAKEEPQVYLKLYLNANVSITGSQRDEELESRKEMKPNEDPA